MKEPCKHCPFRNDVTPFLTQERAEELAYAAQNPYNSFSCHKTTEYDEEQEDMVVTNKSKECAGFLTLQINEGKKIPEGFVPAHKIVYGDSFEMTQTYYEYYLDLKEEQERKK